MTTTQPPMQAVPVRPGASMRPEPARPGLRGDLRTLVREVALVALLLLVYRAARLLTADETREAVANARALWTLQRDLGLPDERHLQDWLLQAPALVQFLNGYYAYVHFPLTAAMLLWLLLRRQHGRYALLRTSLALATGLGLVVHLFLPVAPPRLMAGLGFVDTGSMLGPQVYGEPGGELINQYAAMPSLHVGWAVLVGIALYGSRHAWARVLGVVHPVLTTVVVVVTGNHYWLDGLVGASIAFVAYVVATLWHGQTAGRAEPTRPTLAPIPAELSEPQRPMARRGSDNSSGDRPIALVRQLPGRCQP